MLDVGCGPGTITLDLARRVAPGRVIGVDRAADVLPAPEGNASFEEGDVYSLRFDDESFDVVHAHQMLHHVSDPVAALSEMRRVLRSDGLLAVRESDYGGFYWWPASPMLDRWLEVFEAVMARNGCDMRAGRHVLQWAHAAGFERVEVSSSTWTFATPEDRQWWAASWSERVEQSSFATQAQEYGLCDTDELRAIASGWRAWADDPDAVFVVAHGEVLGWKM